jgi:hypothetical protein
LFVKENKFEQLLLDKGQQFSNPAASLASLLDLQIQLLWLHWLCASQAGYWASMAGSKGNNMAAGAGSAPPKQRHHSKCFQRCRQALCVEAPTQQPLRGCGPALAASRHHSDACKHFWSSLHDYRMFIKWKAAMCVFVGDRMLTSV